MKLKSLALAAVAATTIVSAPAMAALAGGGTVGAGVNSSYSGNGELFLAVYDSNVEISYVLDLGITVNQYVAQQQTFALSLNVNDANWGSFLGQVDANNLRWAVQAYDISGPTWRLLSTVQNGDEGKMEAELIDPWKTGLGPANNFFNAINKTGTHANPVNINSYQYAQNGSSVNALVDVGPTYYGEIGGVGPNLGGFVSLDLSNAVGATAHFIKVENISVETSDPVDVINYTNTWTFAVDGNGAYTLTSAVPEASTLATMLAGLAVLGGLARRRLSA
jgi:hypothetical protein